MDKIDFEEALARLDALVCELEGGALSLDDAMRKYEEGINLTKECSRQLQAAEKKVELLIKKGAGDFDTEDFDDVPRRANKTVKEGAKKNMKKKVSDDDLFFS